MVAEFHSTEPFSGAAPTRIGTSGSGCGMAKKGGWQEEFSGSAASTARPSAGSAAAGGATTPKAQQKVRVQRNQEYSGSELDVLIEGPHEETELLLSARSRFQAPEVDGNVLINDVAEGLGEIPAGHLGRVAITEVSGYDLVGTLVA